MFSTSKKVLVAVVVAMSMSAMVQANGKALYNSLGCAGCHGAGGKSAISTYPSLAGKDAAWIVAQLQDFQSGARKGTIMNAIAPMAAGHEQAIAGYLAKQ